MQRKTVVMNFSHVYEEEHLLADFSCQCIDCTDLQGTNCYCDTAGEEAIRRRIASFSPEGIHWIDSGDYHYLTRLWTEKITRPFALVLFDHHPDMQPSLFDQLLSCGNWVLKMLEENTFLQKVCIIGASAALRQETEGFGDRLLFFDEGTTSHEKAWQLFSSLHLDGTPVYISVDKDVLSPAYARTDWDQGSMTLPQLEALLYLILRQEEVIGIDICGELSVSKGAHAEDESMNLQTDLGLERLLQAFYHE